MTALTRSVLAGALLLLATACGGGGGGSARTGFAGTPPSVTMISPTMGRGGQQVTVTVTGTDLDQTASVSIAGVPLAFVINSPSQLTVTIPASVPGGTFALQFVSSSAGPFSSSNAVYTVAGRDSVMISEISIGGGTSNLQEFIEISNPSGAAFDLSNTYLTEGTFTNNPPNNTDSYYWRVAQPAPQNENCWSGFGSDFIVRFPQGTVIQPGQFIVVGLGDHAAGGMGTGNQTYFGFYNRDPDFEIVPGGDTDSIPDMLDLQATNGFAGSSIGSPDPGLTDGGETVILFQWDGQSDLVQDLDYVNIGDTATASMPEAVDKSGVTVGTSTYLNDTSLSSQAALPGGKNPVNNGPAPFTHQRINFFEGNETSSGGNGITGHDETSEDVNNTFAQTMPASPGLDYPAAPRAGAINVDVGSVIRFQFYRAVDPSSPVNATNFVVSGPGGAVAGTLDFDATTNTVTLTPSNPLDPQANYTVTVRNSILIANGFNQPFFTTDFTYAFTTAP